MTQPARPIRPTQPIQVVVIGGGYAGVMAANRLTGNDGLAVTLVNPRPEFVERIRLHQLISGTGDAVVPFRDVLAARVRLVVGTVSRIDPAARALTLTGGDAAHPGPDDGPHTLPYDYLVYAVGSTATDLGVPGVAEFAHPVAALEDARRLRPLLDATPVSAPVTVVGAGPTGLETAAELAESGRRVTLVCGGPLGPYLHPRGRRSTARQLAALGVQILEGPGSRVTAVTADTVRLADGRVLPSRLTLWTAGLGVPELARRSGLSTDAIGRLLTDETLTSVDDERIIAAGDSAAPSGAPYRMSCQAAVQLGPQAAETVLSRIAGRTPAPVAAGFAGQCVSLGRRAGIIQLARRDDRALRLHVRGRFAARIKEFVCRSTVKQLAYEARKPGARDLWAKDGRRAERLRRAGATAATAATGADPAAAPGQEEASPTPLTPR
ncbi:FAD-dependent oxidoreductase [Streptomyces sp. NPDC048290]|uniref:NAD(P)/FAD-dependent oxidoreductase n=1 Tax=Streptomyces sp. NPDC048290 TaxID=3155811 RepID=UPI003419F64E